MTDAELLFITQQTEHFIRKVLANPGHYVHFSKQKCGGQHRGEIYGRVRDMLRLMGIAFEEKREGYHGTYKLKVSRRDDTAIS